MNLEREAKLSVGPLFRLPDLSAIDEGVHTQDESPQRFVTSYHDTDDLRLARWGASLRYRTGEGWTVKLPQPNGPLRDLGAIVRQEHVFEAGPGKPPPPALDLVRAFVRTEPVSLSVRLQTLRRRTELLGTDDAPLAEVVDDEVSVLDGRRVVGRFRELEVELAPEGDERILRAALVRLRKEGAETSKPLPKHVRALQPRSTQPPDVEPMEPAKDATVSEVVRAALSGSAARRSGATRSCGSTRTQRACTKPGWRPGGSARTCAPSARCWTRSGMPISEPSWGGSAPNSVRSVTSTSSSSASVRKIAGLPDADPGATPKLLDRLRVQRDEARAELLSAMREERYAVLLDRVVAAATQPVLLADVGDRRASELLADLMAKPWAHLERACDALGPASVDGELHEARIRAKRVRYAAEALLPVAPKRAKRFAKRATALQEYPRTASGCRRGGCVAPGAGGRDHRARRVRRRRTRRGRIARASPGAEGVAPRLEAVARRRCAVLVRTQVRAAGGVVRRRGVDGVRYALVHRPRYDDWSLPKGKADDGEDERSTALREVLEETGFRCDLGPMVTSVRYHDHEGRAKVVAYWLMYPLDGVFLPNVEVDEMRWVDVDEARSLLTYSHDRAILDAAVAFDRPVALVRHAKAGDREAWTEDDRLRPLTKKGKEQAEGLVELLAELKADRVLSSPSVRCVQTVRPLALSRHVAVEEREELLEGAPPGAALQVLRSIGGAVVACSHGDLIPRSSRRSQVVVSNC